MDDKEKKDELKRQSREELRKIPLEGVNRTMVACVLHAKRNHPGWRNITGVAEGSIDILQLAKLEGKEVIGRWGSRGVHYMIWLEIKHGSALRNAADVEYPKLAARIKRAFSSQKLK